MHVQITQQRKIKGGGNSRQRGSWRRRRRSSRRPRLPKKCSRRSGSHGVPRRLTGGVDGLNDGLLGIWAVLPADQGCSLGCAARGKGAARAVRLAKGFGAGWTMAWTGLKAAMLLLLLPWSCSPRRGVQQWLMRWMLSRQICNGQGKPGVLGGDGGTHGVPGACARPR